MIKWLKNFFSNSIKKEYKDYFQIRKISLVDGTIKYYPEYRTSVLDVWQQLQVARNNHIDLRIIDNGQLYSINHVHYNTESEAKELIEMFKKQLLTDRAKDLQKEEIIKVE